MEINSKSNPAAIFRDLCINTEYGMGLTLTDTQEANITAWEKWLEEEEVNEK